MRPCPTCRESCVTDRHACPPAFDCWRPEYGEDETDARTIYADHAMAAARVWAERSDSRGDYEIVRGSEATVHVRAPDGALFVFVVSGETVPEYHARLVTEKPASEKEHTS